MVLQQNKVIQIRYPENEKEAEAVGALCRRLDEYDDISKEMLLTEGTPDTELLKRYYEKKISIDKGRKEGTVLFVPCEHFRKVTENILPDIWFDKYLNCICDEHAYQAVRAYPCTEEFFKNLLYDWLMKGILAERERA